MKKWINKQTIAAFIIGAILFSGIGAGAATLYQFMPSNDVLYVDGKHVDKSMYKYEGTNYLPIRAVAETLDMDVGYITGRVDIDRRREPTIAEVAEKVRDSCVLIRVYDKDILVGTGSGVVYNSYVITAKHVLDMGVKYAVTYDDMDDNMGYDVERIPVDTDLDIGLLKAPIRGHTAILGDSDSVKIGQKVINVSSPGGIKNFVLDGTVINKGMGIFTTIDGGPGSSGSGIFDMDGKLVGILTNGFTELEDASMSIPINKVKKLLNTIN